MNGIVKFDGGVAVTQPPGTFVFEDASLEPARPPNWYDEAARKKLGQSRKWQSMGYEPGDTHCVVSGGIPRELKSGERKGQMTWHGCVITKCAIDSEDINQAKLDYELETGKCHVCAGSGLRLDSWACGIGNRYRFCERCGNTGHAPEVGL